MPRSWVSSSKSGQLLLPPRQQGKQRTGEVVWYGQQSRQGMLFQDQELRTQDRKRARLHAQAKELGLQLVPVESMP